MPRELIYTVHDLNLRGGRESHKVQSVSVSPTSECWHTSQRSPETPERLQILSGTGPKEVRDVL